MLSGLSGLSGLYPSRVHTSAGLPADPDSDTFDTTGWKFDTDTRTWDGGVFSPVVASWYDSVDPSSTNTTEATETTFSIAQKVVAGSEGSCTKLRFYNLSISGTVSVKMALYDDSNVLLGSGSVSISPGSTPDASFIECILTSPVTVTNGVTYRVACEVSANAGFNLRYLSGQPSGSSYINFGSSYAAFPQNPNTGLTPLGNVYCAGMYIE